jgi:hypothetical protein
MRHPSTRLHLYEEFLIPTAHPVIDHLPAIFIFLRMTKITGQSTSFVQLTFHQAFFFFLRITLFQNSASLLMKIPSFSPRKV